MASGFEEIYGKDGLISKVRANFGKSKEVCMNAFNGKTYIHITDKSKCFVNGKFDPSKSKSVTLSYEESLQLKGLIEIGGVYDVTFHQQGVSQIYIFDLCQSWNCYRPISPVSYYVFILFNQRLIHPNSSNNNNSSSNITLKDIHSSSNINNNSHNRHRIKISKHGPMLDNNNNRLIRKYGTILLFFLFFF
jgi:hypothetical protein